MRKLLLICVVFFSLLPVIALAQSGAGLLDDLEAYWDLNETSGTRYDSHSSYDFTDVNTVVSTENGKLGYAASFASASGEALSSTLDIESTSWTVAGWVKSSSASGTIWARWEITNQFKLTYSENSFNAVFALGPTSTTTVTLGTASQNIWHFVAQWRNGSTCGIRLNDQDFSVACSGVVTDTTAAFVLGAGNFDGAIDEVGVWLDDLTSSQLDVLYNDRLGLAYTSFEEGEAAGPSDTVYFPLIMINYPSDDDTGAGGDAEDIELLGPPMFDDSWRIWADVFDAIINPILSKLLETEHSINESLVQGCVIEGEFMASLDDLDFDPEGTTQEHAYMLGIALGKPIGILRGFALSGMAPINFLRLLLNFLLVGIIWVVFVMIMTTTFRIIRAVVEFMITLWHIVRG